MTDDLERSLRTMLDERAGDIRSVPEHLLPTAAPDLTDERIGDAEVLDLGLRRADIMGAARRHWPLITAAAAVIAVVSGVLALLAGSPAHDDSVPPAHHGPHLKTVVRPACRTTLPTAWEQAVSAATARVQGAGGSDVAAVTEDGGAVIETDGAETATYSGRRFGYLAPGASSVRWLTTIGIHFADAHSFHSSEIDIDVTGHTAVLTLESGGRTPVTRSIVALDLDTGRRTLLATSAARTGTIEHQAYALNGIAYWEVFMRTSGHRLAESIHSRPVGGGVPSTLASAGSYDLQKSALGIEWNLEDGPPDRLADVPTLVARHGTSGADASNAFNSYLSDGHVYVWQTLQGDLDWYDASTNRLIRVPHLLGVPGVAPGQAALFAVAGPIVYYQDQQGTGDRILDVRTGADMALPVTGDLFGASGRLVGSPGALIKARSGSTGLLWIRGSALPAAPC